MNHDLEMLWKEVVVTYVTLLTQQLPGENEKNHKNLSYE
jgi:hypothetical protein